MVQKINKITHQELMLVFGYTKGGAMIKLTSIRKSLEKKENQILTVTDLCRYEGISLDDFDIMLQRSMGK